MGRYSSDSEEEKKKRKKKKKRRSRSRSESIESRHSTKQKKSKKKKKRRSRSRSRSSDRYRRSRSRSYDRRSRSKDRYRKRSVSRSRYSRSRSRSRDRRRRRSRSYDSYSRSSRRSRSYTPDRKSRKNRSEEREDPCANIPGFADMTPAEQAKIRMHMALKAAAAADEKLKADVTRSQSSTSLQDSLSFSQAIQDIESANFVASSFKSSRGDKKEEKMNKDEFLFGTAGELRLDSQKKPILVDVEKEELAHPSLYTDSEEKLDKWIQKLATMRRKKLEGEALT